MRLWQTIIAFGLVLNLLLVACGPFPSQPPDDPCLSAKIVSPRGAEWDKDASHPDYRVTSEIAISWQPDSCVMTVQSYQKKMPKPIHEYKGVVSGTKLKIGNPSSGVTEIKLWREGFNDPAHSIWVMIE